MGQNRVETLVEELVLPIVEEENFELVDVEFKKEGPHRYLRIFIDKPGGITLDDCSKISGALSDLLDELDPIEENYFLEVSSPGLDRPLKKDADFHKFKGQVVEVKLYEPLMGQKVLEGELLGLVDNIIQLNIGSAGLIEIPKDKVALTRLAIKF